MGMTYARLDKYLLTGEGKPDIIAKIERYHTASIHKTAMPEIYCENIL